MITVRLFGAARACAGKSEILMDVKNLDALTNHLRAEYPSIAPVLVKCSYLVNEVSQRDMLAQLNDGDTVDVLPPFAGGSR